jgi:sugar phosphate isomerase/epimerase
MRLGGPIFESSKNPVALAKAHRALGYRAAYCPNVDIKDAAQIKAIQDAFAAEDVLIAEVGAWCNLLAVDEAKRQKHFTFVCERLALADAVGARCCVDYIGTLAPNSDFGSDPANLTASTFHLAVETVQRIIDEVKPARTFFCLEMMQWLYPDSPDAYVELLRAVDRPAFGVHLDPVNLVVSPRIYFDTTALLRECFHKLGPHIRSCHAKDITLRGELALHLDEVIPGAGNLDYRTYLTELSRLPGEVPIMLEHLTTPEQYTQARNHLLDICKEEGIPTEHA